VAWIKGGGGNGGMGIRFRTLPLVDRMVLANFMINRMYA